MLSTNNTSVQIIKETNDALIVKCVGFFANSTGEADVVKVNAESLLHKTTILRGDNTSVITALGFIPGEKVTGGSSNTVAYVTYYGGPVSGGFGGDLTVIDSDGNFQDGETITGERSHSTLTNIGVIIPSRRLDIESVFYAIAGAANAMVEIEWSGFDVALLSTYSDDANGVFTPDSPNTDPSQSLSNGENVLINGDPFTIDAINSSTFTVSTGNSTGNLANAAVQPSIFPTAIMLPAGSGYHGRNALQAELIPPAMNVTTGDILFSTHSMGAESSYSIILEIRKQIGYAQIPAY